MADNQNSITKYTRCPQCETAFKVSEKMLAMANGKVRCGACLSVFQANEHFVKPKQKHPVKQPVVKPEQPEEQLKEQARTSEKAVEQEKIDALETNIEKEVNPEVENEFSNQSELLSSDVEVSELTATFDDQPLGSNVEAQEQSSLFETEFNREPEKTELEESEPEEFEPEKFEPEESESEEPEIAPIDNSQKTTDLNISASQVESGQIESEFHIEPEINADIDDTFFDEDFSTENQLQEDIDDVDLSDAISNNSEQFDTALEELAVADDESVIVEERVEESIEESSASDPEMSELDIDGELLSESLVTQIEETDTEPDPLDEFEDRVVEKKSGIKLTIIVAVIALLLIAGIMQFWKNRQALAWSEQWSAPTLLVCDYLPCELKPKRDISALKIRQRIIEPSDVDENKLNIKILLVNQANFDQPYPRITIHFSNQLGERVATKQLEVKDYFAEKVGQLIPANAEVHLNFETDMPHADALGFEFIFD